VDAHQRSVIAARLSRPLAEPTAATVGCGWQVLPQFRGVAGNLPVTRIGRRGFYRRILNGPHVLLPEREQPPGLIGDSGPSSAASAGDRSATAVMCRSGSTIRVPSPNGPTQCSTSQNFVRWMRPPGNGRHPVARSQARQSSPMFLLCLKPAAGGYQFGLAAAKY